MTTSMRIPVSSDLSLPGLLYNLFCSSFNKTGLHALPELCFYDGAAACFAYVQHISGLRVPTDECLLGDISPPRSA